MIPRPINEISIADLQRLIENQVGEGRTIEYKRELPGPGDGGPVKILRSISSFANSSDGDLLYGVEARDGLPIALPGLEAPNEDEIHQRLENMSRDGVQPRMPHPQFRFVRVGEERSVLIIRVAKSWNAPHRVTIGGHAHFYGRNSAGSYPLDVGELRTSFTQSETIVERIRNFRAGRLLALGSGETPLRMYAGAKLVLHIVPLDAFTGAHQLIDIQAGHENLSRVAPIGANGSDHRFTLEGLINFTSSAQGESRAYIQIYRSGIVEAVAVFTEHDGNRTIYSSYEGLLMQAVPRYLGIFQAAGINPPAFLMLSFVGVKDYVFATDGMRFFNDDHSPFNRDMLVLPESVIQDLSASPAAILRPSFDLVWNSFGYERSFNFDEAGNWIQRR